MTIGVRAFAQDTGFLIVASEAPDYIVLSELVPYLDEVAQNSIKYYAIVANKTHDPFEIILTPLSGDPDMYVGLNFLPNETTHDHVAMGVGKDVILIDNTACKTVSWHGQDHCMYYIGVTGFQRTNASYSLLWVSQGYIDLTVGNPQVSRLPTMALRFVIYLCSYPAGICGT